MSRHVLALVVLLGTCALASAESFKLGPGKYQEGHEKKCKHPLEFEWLVRIVSRAPLIACNHGEPDTMSIQSGKEPPLFADTVDRTTGWWKLDETHRLMISIDPLAHPREAVISIGILERSDDVECYEKWVGAGVRQPEVKP